MSVILRGWSVVDHVMVAAVAVDFVAVRLLLMLSMVLSWCLMQSALRFCALCCCWCGCGRYCCCCRWWGGVFVKCVVCYVNDAAVVIGATVGVSAVAVVRDVVNGFAVADVVLVTLVIVAVGVVLVVGSFASVHVSQGGDVPSLDAAAAVSREGTSPPWMRLQPSRGK